MQLTEQTLKMARISGLEYATATDYMTNAIRSFKLEASDAQKVVDVYSAVAASSATNTAELATAMSKTASSAESVGASFENTTAMMAVMIEATRESATNIGSALKSIISRYGEMKADPSKIVDSEGEEMSLNKVDKALQTVGISIHNAAGQFREFDDVITELAGKWDTIDTNTQRYIATIMAGNRQQSRFLALVSNGERLAELSEEAANAEDTATLQVLKTMDSIEAKSQQLQTSLQSMFTETGIEKLYKGILDFGNEIINTFTRMPTLFKLPIPAIMSFAQIFISLGSSLTTAFKILQERLKADADLTNQKILVSKKIAAGEELNAEQQKVAKELEIEKKLTEDLKKEHQQRAANAQNAAEQEAAARTNATARVGGNSPFDIDKIDWSKFGDRAPIVRYDYQHFLETGSQDYAANLKAEGIEFNNNVPIMPYLEIQQGAEEAGKSVITLTDRIKGTTGAILGLRMAGSSLQMIAAGMNEATASARGLKGAIQLVGGAMQALSFVGNPIMMAFTIATTAVSVLSTWIETAEERLQRLSNTAEELTNKALQAKADQKTLQQGIEKVKELEQTRYDSAEAAEEYQNEVEKLAQSFPELIRGFDEAGNVIIDVTSGEDMLAAAREKTAQATYDAAKAELAKAKEEQQQTENKIKQLAPSNDQKVSLSGYTIDENTSGNKITNLASDIFNTHYSWDHISTLKDFINTLKEEKNTEDQYFGYLSQYVADRVNNGVAITDFDELKKIVNDNKQHADIKPIADLFDALADETVDLTDLTAQSIVEDFIQNLANYDFKTKEGQDAFKQFQENYEKLNPEIQKVIKDLYFDPNELSILIKDLGSQTATTEGFSRSVISAWINFDKVNQKGWEFLQGNNEAALILTERLSNLWNTDKFKDLDFDTFKTQNEVKDKLDEFQNTMQIIFSNATDSQKEQFDTLLKNKGNYTNTQFVNELSKIFNATDAELQGIADYYYEGVTSFEDYISALALRYKNQDFKLLGGQYQHTDLLETLGSDELQHILSIYDNIAGQIKAKNISPQLGQDILNSYFDIWEATNQLDDKSREIAQGILKTTDFSSLIGVDELRNSLEQADLGEGVVNTLVELATIYANLMPENLIIDFETMSKNMVSQIDDFEKALKNASKGMGLEDATKMAEKLDLSLGDFDFKAGQYFFKDANAIKDAYYKYNEETIKELDEQFGKEITDLGRQIVITQKEGEDTTALEQKRTDLITAHKNLKAAIEQYGEYQVNAILIQNGMLEDFLKSVLGEEATVEEINKQRELIMNGKYGKLDDAVKPYITELYNLTNGWTKSIFDKAIESFENQENVVVDASQMTQEQKTLLEALGAELQEGTETYLLNITKENYKAVEQQINALKGNQLSVKTADAYLKQIHDINYEDNVYDALKNVVGSFNNFSYEAGQQLARAVKDIDINEFGTDINGNLISNYDQILTILDKKILDHSSKRYTELRAELEKKQTELSDTAIFSNIIQNRDKLSEENIAALATLFKTSYDAVRNQLKANGDGTYTATLQQIQTLARAKGLELNESIRQLIASQIDGVISSITGLAGSQSKGFTDLASMQKFASRAREAGFADASIKTLFDYDNTLHAYRLNTEGLIRQVEILKGELDKLSDEEAEVAQQLIQDTQRQFAEQIDISTLVDTEFGSEASVRANQAIVKAVEDYNAIMMAMANVGEKVELLNADALINSIGAGGQVAVEAAQKIAELQGKTLSASDIEGFYRREISNYVDAIDKVTAKPGEIVDAVTAAIIGLDNTEQLSATGQYVVKSAANLYEAYNKLLNRMRATGEATLADLNKVAALALENRDGEQQVIDALGDAAGMTFTRFGEILADAGIELTEDMVNKLEDAGIIDLIGGNKMRIMDFSAFAKLMNWSPDSEEYVSAFKTYNDSLIELNRKAEHNILEEAKNAASAKGGDWVNLTQLWEKINGEIGKETFNGAKLNNILYDFGGKIEDGILKLNDNANIPAILQAVAEAAAQSGSLISSELAELADAVADAIKSYADLISGGISGSLSNVQAEQLQDWANKVGVGKLDFTETEEGLKVATDQAFELVKALQKVDSMQGKLTFNNLVDALSSDKGGRFENISKTTAEIAKAQREIAENNQKIDFLQKDDEKTNAKDIQALKDKNAKLREQIDLYREIQQRQSIDPSQYNFMDRDLPEVMQGPINYWNSVGKAFSAMNTAGQTGKMEIQDFYNIVNEMSNLMAISGQTIEMGGVTIDGSAENAAKLIQKGMGALKNVDGKGVQIDLSKIGINFASGADSMKQNFAEGVKSLAESQVAMLDAAIQVLETVVAMEKLGDISVDENPEFSFGDIFNIDEPPEFDKETGQKWYEFTEEYNDWREKIIEKLNPENKEKYDEDLDNAMKAVNINGHSLKELLDTSAKDIAKLGISQQDYFNILDGFRKAAESGDYNLDTIQDSVWQTLEKAGLTSDMTIEVGDHTIVVSGGTKYIIDWQDEDVQEAVKAVQDRKKLKENEAKTYLTDLFTKYEAGEDLEDIDILTVLHAKGEIEVVFDNKGNPKFVKTPDGREVDPSSQEGQEIIAKAALKAKGLTEDDIWGEQIDISSDGTKKITLYGKIKIGEAEIQVESDGEGNLTYVDPKTGLKANTLNELKQKMIDKYIRDNSSGYDPTTGNYTNAPTTYQAKVALFGIDIEPEVKVNTENVDDPEVQKKALEAVHKSTKELEELINNGTDGYSKGEGSEPGYLKYTLNGIEVEVEDTGDETKNIEAAKAKIAELVKSLELANTITEAIKQAFSSEDNAFGNAIAAAIVAGFGSLTSEQLGEQEIPELLAKISTLVINSIDSIRFATKGSGGLNKDLGGSDITIPTATASIANLIIDTTSSTPTITQPENGYTVSSANITATNANLTASKIDESGLKLPESISKNAIEIYYSLLKLTSSGLKDSSELNVPTKEEATSALNIIYALLKLVHDGEDGIDESGVYIPQYLSTHPEMSALLSLILLKSVSTTEYNDDNVSNPKQLEKSLKTAALLAQIALSSDENTKILSGSINIKDKEIKIYDVLKAIASGPIMINSPEGGSSIIEGTITIGKGEEQITLTGTEFYTLINNISGRLGPEYTGPDLSQITIPEEIYLGQTKGVIDVEVEYRDYDDLDIGDKLNRINNDVPVGKKAAIQNEIDSDELKGYVDGLTSAVAQGESLSQIDFSNLEMLNQLGEDNLEDLGLSEEQIANIKQTVESATTIISDSKTVIETATKATETVSSATEEVAKGVNTLSSLVVGDLPNIATALTEIAAAAERMQSVDWSTISSGLSSILGITSPEDSILNQDNGAQQLAQLGAALKDILNQITTENVTMTATNNTLESPTFTLDNGTINVADGKVNVTMSGPTDNSNGGGQGQGAGDGGAGENGGQTTTTGEISSLTASNLSVDGLNSANITSTSSVITNGSSTIAAGEGTTINAEGGTITGTITLSGNTSGSEESDGEQTAGTIDISSLTSAVESVQTSVNDTASSLDKLSGAISSLPDKSQEVNNTAEAMDKLKSKSVTFTGKVVGTVDGTIKAHISADGAATADAKFNESSKVEASGSANAKGTASANGSKTLVGELGPELIVSNGRYFVAGQDGPEMIDLADDSIVFNHLQTKKLLASGKVGTRGKPQVSERKSISFATGNVEGPAFASASEALAALKQLRAMWQSLARASLRDMGGLGNGSGGGGGGGGQSQDPKYLKAVTEEVERWYNWLQEIEETQQRINKLTKEYTLLEKQGISSKERIDNLKAQAEERRRNIQVRQDLIRQQKEDRQKKAEDYNKGLMGAFYNVDKETGAIRIANDDEFINFISGLRGGAIASSLRREGKIAAGTSIKLNDAEIKENYKSYASSISKSEYDKLSKEEKKYYKKDKKGNYKKKKLSETNYAKEHGSIKFQREIKSGLDLMSELQAEDAAGQKIHSAREQYQILKSFGILNKFPGLMKDVDTSQEGWETTVVENFYAAIEADKGELESLTESINEQEQAALDDAAAILDINDQIREMTTPVAGVTEAMERWYNTLRKIEATQNRLNQLAKIGSLYEQDQVANGDKIYQNLKDQLNALRAKRKANQEQIENLKKQREEQSQTLAAMSAWVEIDQNTGQAVYKANNDVGSISYQTGRKIKKTTYEGQEYETDVYGRFIDSAGNLRDARGNLIEKKTFGTAVKDAKGNYLKKDIEYDENGNMRFKGADGKMHIVDRTGKDITEGFGEFKPVTDKTQHTEYDEEGNWIDREGMLRNSAGQLVGKEVAQLATTEGQTVSTDVFKGKTLPEIMAELTATDEYGKAKYSADEQRQIAEALGIQQWMQYDENGRLIYNGSGERTNEESTQAVEAAQSHFEQAVNEFNETTQAIDDTINENLDLTAEELAIQQQILDKESEFKDQMKEAVVQMKQNRIDDLKEEKDALEESSNNIIEGLSDALEKEKRLYESDKNESELNKLQNQLAILQRSGGSISQIRSLEEQIASKQKDMYFDERQAQIDAIKEASDKQIEKMEEQISIMQDTLDWQIESGQIWKDVESQLEGMSPEQIADFMTNYNKDYAAMSAEDKAKTFREALEQGQFHIAFTTDAENPIQQVNEDVTNELETVETQLEHISGQLTTLGGGDAYSSAAAAERAKKGWTAFKESEPFTEQQKRYLSNEANSANIQKAYNERYNKAYNEAISGGKKEEEAEAYARQQAAEAARGAINEGYKAQRQAAWEKYAKDNKLKETLNEEQLGKIRQAFESTYDSDSEEEAKKKADEARKRLTGGNGEGTQEGTQEGQEEKVIYTLKGNIYSYDTVEQALLKSKNNRKSIPAGTKIEVVAYHSEPRGDDKAIILKGKDGRFYPYLSRYGTVNMNALNSQDLSSPVGIYHVTKKDGINAYPSLKDALNKTKKGRVHIDAGKDLEIKGISKKKRSGTNVEILKTSDGKFVPYLSSWGKLLNRGKLPIFEKGGLIDFTGPAWVDGTKEKPEGIFNFDQIKLLKEYMLSSQQSTSRMIQDVIDAQEAMTALTQAVAQQKLLEQTEQNNDSSINIEHVEMSMEIQSIANDYDARRAGQQALEEMVRIARKTGNRSVTRR